MLTWALRYSELGWPVVPVWWPVGATKPTKRAGCGCAGRGPCSVGRPGKHPIVALAPHGVHDATTDAATIERWWRKYPEASPALAMGRGRAALDVDTKSDGHLTLARLLEEHGALPQSPHNRTGAYPAGRGAHFFFAVDVTTAKARTVVGPGLELLGDGHYVLAPPALHEMGNRYEIIVPPTEPLAPLPAWLFPRDVEVTNLRASAPVTDDLHRRLVRASAYLTRMDPAIAGSGGHAATWRAVLAMVRGFGLSPDDALALLVADYNPRCKPPWSLRELRHKVQDAARSQAPPWLADSAGPEGRGRPGGIRGPAESASASSAPSTSPRRATRRRTACASNA